MKPAPIIIEIRAGHRSVDTWPIDPETLRDQIVLLNLVRDQVPEDNEEHLSLVDGLLNLTTSLSRLCADAAE